jgi:hypothetical protein
VQGCPRRRGHRASTLLISLAPVRFATSRLSHAPGALHHVPEFGDLPLRHVELVALPNLALDRAIHLGHIEPNCFYQEIIRLEGGNTVELVHRHPPEGCIRVDVVSGRFARICRSRDAIESSGKLHRRKEIRIGIGGAEPILDASTLAARHCSDHGGPIVYPHPARSGA